MPAVVHSTNSRRVAKVSDLFAINTSQINGGDFVEVLGYDSIGDGGFQPVYWDETDNATVPDGGIVFPGLGGTLSFNSSGTFTGTGGNGRFKAAWTDEVNFSRHGIKPGVSGMHERMQSAINRAVALNKPLVAPAGEYLVEDTLSLPANSNPFVMRGAGRGATIFTCSVAGAPAFDFGDATFLTLEKFSMIGGVTSGHGLYLVDPDLTTGAFKPQQVRISEVQITGFGGTDTVPQYVAGGGTPQAIGSCGIVIIDGLECKLSNVYVSENKFGIYAYAGQTVRIFHSAVALNSIAGIVLQRTESSSVSECDVVANGDATVATITLPFSAKWASNHLAGGIMCIDDHGTVIEKNKMKTNGRCCVYLSSDFNPKVQKNWIRTDTLAGSPQKLYGVYSTNGCRVDDNDFYTSNSSHAKAQVSVQQVAALSFGTLSIENNRFHTVAGGTYTEIIEIVQNGNANHPMSGVIRLNEIGGPENPANALTITDVIKITGAVGELSITDNVLHASGANFSVTDVFDFSGVTKPTTNYTRGTLTVSNNAIRNVFLTALIEAEFNMPSAADARVIRIERDTGSPEGVVAGSPGSEFVQTDAGATGTTAIRWLKTSGGHTTSGWRREDLGTPQTLSVGASIVYNVLLGNNALLASPGSGNTIANLTNAAAGDEGQLKIQGSANNPSWGANWDFGDDDGWTLTTSTSECAIVTWSVAPNGKIHAVVKQGFASPF